jgi:hypothetical protein
MDLTGIYKILFYSFLFGGNTGRIFSRTWDKVGKFVGLWEIMSGLSLND